MSPELITPSVNNSRPTRSSDCYALGMVIYETVSGNLPFHEHADLAVVVKVLAGERPLRGAWFVGSLWKLLEQCWASQPNNRPSIEDVLLRLEMISSLSEPHSPGVDDETEEDGDDWDSASGPSDVPNGASGTMKTEEGTTTSPDLSDIDDLHRSPRELPLYGRDGARRTTGKFYQEGGSDIWDKNGAASVPSRDEADSPGNLQNPVSHLAFVVRCVRDPQRPVQAPCSRTAEKDAIQPFS
jgi:serine/threonine protein kinase